MASFDQHSHVRVLLIVLYVCSRIINFQNPQLSMNEILIRKLSMLVKKISDSAKNLFVNWLTK